MKEILQRILYRIFLSMFWRILHSLKNIAPHTPENIVQDIFQHVLKNIEQCEEYWRGCCAEYCTALSKEKDFVEDHDEIDSRYSVDLKTPKLISNEILISNHKFHPLIQIWMDCKCKALQDKVSISPAMEKHMEVNFIIVLSYWPSLKLTIVDVIAN